MKNFKIYNPVKLHFGKGVLTELPDAINEYGKNILLMYGKGSVIKNGYYKQLTDLLKKHNYTVSEYSGIKSNPVVEDVANAVEKGIAGKVDVIIALGGGSVIDSAKLAGVCIPDNLVPWDVVKSKVIPKKSIPVIAVLTLAATGTEMNPFAVIQNHKTEEKIGFGYPIMYPKHSFLDPEFTYTVSEEYTAYGISDIIAHCFENFFGKGDSPLADKFAGAIITETMRCAQTVFDEPDNYEARSNILLQSTCALNGITQYGKSGGDWGVHSIGHVLSLLYDMPHGASLSVVYPAWFKLFKNRIPERLSFLSQMIFNHSDAEQFIEDMKSFYLSLNCPVSLKSEGFAASEKEIIYFMLVQNKASGNHYKLSEDDLKQIVEFMFE